MIIWLILILVIALVASITLINPVVVRWSISIVVAGLLLMSVGAMSANMSVHWGMQRITSVQTKTIYSAGSSTAPVGVLIKKEIGTNSGRYVFVYKNHARSSKATAHFVPDSDDTVNAVKTTAAYQMVDQKTATVKIKTTRWVWKSSMDRFWLQIGDSDSQLISRKVVVSVPKETWMVLTADQAQKLSTQQQ